ncbi:Secologanin synthase [Hordeum vulgare]|nr:Secologanin synthase [Hordeum vulgare]
MEPSNNLLKMEPAKVPEDLIITLAQKIRFATRHDRRVKAKPANKEKLKKRLAVGGPGGDDVHEGRGERDRWYGRDGRRETVAPAVQMAVPWSKSYKPP